jgi:prolyl oligopeptidase
MIRRAVLAVSLLSALALSGASGRFTYPKAPTSNQVDDYHGTKVADPYRPLENPDAPATRAWIDAENALTRSYLDAIPERAAIRERLTKLWDYERYGTPFREGGRTFYTRNDGLQNQAVLWVVDAPGAAPRVLLDPNTLSADGTVALTGTAVSPDGSLLAYGTAASGSDWSEWRVRGVGTAKDSLDVLKWVKFSSANWSKDGKGFYYARYDAPASGRDLDAVVKNQKVYHHRVGTPQAEDSLVYSNPSEPDLLYGIAASDDGRFLILTTRKGSQPGNRFAYKDLSAPNLSAPAAPFVTLVATFADRFSFIENDGPTLFLRTDKDAPRGRLVAVNTASPDPMKTLRNVIPEGDGVLKSVDLVADRFVTVVSKNVSDHIRFHALSGTLEKELPLPGLGTVGGLRGKRKDRDAFYSFTSFTVPTAIFRYDFASGASEIFKRPTVDFDPAAYETEQVFYPSKDGTKIPMFLVHKKGLKKDGDNPTLLYGYGGFAIAEMPSFSVKNLAFIEMGGLYALANLRGGSEYGEDWHRAGRLDKKQNVFDDFAAAARWLTANGYTSPKRLAISGGSNGGLLVGATLNQHPELFAAAVPAVGVMDMLRFQKFTIGWAWVADYGSSEKPEQFKFLYAYSPLHNIRKGGTYPPVLVTTADHDDRVVPAHSFKYTAALQAAQSGEAPILIRIETKAGHGAGKPTTKQIEEATDVLGFLRKNLWGLKPAPSP